MDINVVITGNDFNKSFVALINDDINLKSLINNYPEEIAILIKSEFNDGIENIISKNIYLEIDFAQKLNLLDSIDCSCISHKTSLGAVIKEIMIDNYQLVLTRKHWRETNKLTLFFDAVIYGEVDDFIRNSFNREYIQKAY